LLGVRVHSVFVRDSGVKVADQEDNLPTRYMGAFAPPPQRLAQQKD
jgi:hypothetical protein